MVWGFLRPVILLPIDANHWQTERLRAVLLHELAHIKRWDWTMQMVARIACAIYWFNPLVWFATRWMRIEAEQACDDHVLNAGYRSTDYAQHLIDITRNVKIAKTTSLAAVTIARSSKIERRLRTVLAKNLNRHPMTKVAAGIGLLVFICFAIPMGAMRLAQAINPEEGVDEQIQETSTLQPIPEQLLPKSQVYGQDARLKQDQENIEICIQNLLAIGKAIQTYQKEHNDFPRVALRSSPEILGRCKQPTLSGGYQRWQATLSYQRRSEDACELWLPVSTLGIEKERGKTSPYMARLYHLRVVGIISINRLSA